MLTNGDFEVDTSGWSPDLGSLARTTTTVHSGSGAAEGTLGNYGGNYYFVAYQCVNLSDYPGWPEVGGTRYLTYNGWLHSDGTTIVYLNVQYQDGANCTGNSLGGIPSANVTTNAWEFVSVTSAIPSGASSFHLIFYAVSGSPGVFYADDLAAFSSSATAVESDGGRNCELRITNEEMIG